jgi:hypothetical protein
LAQLFYFGFFLLCANCGLFHPPTLPDYYPSVIFDLNPYQWFN